MWNIYSYTMVAVINRYSTTQRKMHTTIRAHTIKQIMTPGPAGLAITLNVRNLAWLGYFLG